MTGPEEISASHEKSFTRFEGSQHFVAGHDISLDGSTANVRANLIAMHMWQGSKADANKPDNFFVAGGVIHATLTQSDLSVRRSPEAIREPAMRSASRCSTNEK